MLEKLTATSEPITLTGKKLWEFQTGAGANAACALYELGGKLHVAVASGGNAQINAPRGDNLIVFTVD